MEKSGFVSRVRENGRRAGLRVGVLAFAVAVVSACAFADPVARVLVTLETSVDLYEVDEQDSWAKVRTICSGVGCTYSAVMRSGVIYVSTATAEGASTGTVRMFDFKGNPLGSLPEVPCRCDHLAVSPDGAYLFTAHGADKNIGQGGGKVYRYSFARGEWELFANVGESCIRAMAFKGDTIYVAFRYVIVKRYKWGADVSGGPVSPMSNFGTGMKFASGLCINPADGYLWWSGRSSETVSFGRADPDDNSRHEEWSGGYQGWSSSLTFVNGKLYIGTYNATVGLWKRTGEAAFEKVLSSKIYDLSVINTPSAASWDFSGTVDTPAFEGKAESPVWPAGGACGGAVGVDGTALCFRGARSRAEIARSHGLLPATNDFALTLWVGMPSVSSATGGRYILSNAFGQDGSLSVLADPDAGHLNKLALAFAPDTNATPVTITTDAVVADGFWHHVALARRGGSLEIWLDGERVGTASVAAAAVAQDVNWHLGCSGEEEIGFIGAGAFMDEMTLYDDVPLVGEMPGLASKYSPGALPAIPAASAAVPAAMPAAYGTQIAHATAMDAPLGNPHFFIASDGTYWVAADRANGPAAADQLTTLWASADRGATWTQSGTIAAGGVSLFESGNALCAMGMKAQTGAYLDGCRTCAVWSFADGEWTELCTYDSPDSIYMAPCDVVVANGRAAKPVSIHSTPNTGSSRVAYLAFPANGAAFGAPFRYETHNATIENSDHASYVSTVYRMLPGCAVAMPDGTCAHYVPIVDDDSPRIQAVRNAERAWCEKLLFSGSAANGYTRLSNCRDQMLRGGAKPFDIKYDAQSGLYWALTVPATNTSEIAARKAYNIRNVLALYASEDLEAWMPCGTVAVAGGVDETGFNGPSFKICGDDLDVVVGVSCEDGAGGPRSTAHNTYLAFRRIANFRTAFAPKRPGGSRMLVADMWHNMVYSMWRDDADGEWYDAGLFIDPEKRYGGIFAANPRLMAVHRDRVYITMDGSNPTAVLAFNNQGMFRRILTAPQGVNGDITGIAISPGGKTLYVSADKPSSAIYRVNPKSGEWSAFIDCSAGNPVNKPYHMTTGPDGSLYVGNYGPVGARFAVNRFDADGNLVSQMYSGAYPVSGLAVDEEGRYLYVSHSRGNIHRVEIATGTATQICDRYVNLASPAYALQIFDGRLYVTSTWGWTYAIDLGTFEETAPIGTHFSAWGVAVIDSGWRRGFTIDLK